MTLWTLHHGDALEVLATLHDASVDLVVTDPPYGISQPGVTHIRPPGRGSRRFDLLAGDDDWRAVTLGVVVPAVRETCRVLTATGSAYWWLGFRQIGVVCDVLEECGFRTRMLGWHKPHPPPAPPGSGWPSALEVCIYAHRPGRHFDPAFGYGSNVFTSDTYRNGMPGKVNHPTQKPLAVLRPLICASSRPGDLVLDPFAGSGSVGVAALLEGRRYVGVEREARYMEIARGRLQEAEGGVARLPHPQQVRLFGAPA